MDYHAVSHMDDPARIFDMSGRVGLIVGGAGKLGQEFAKTLVLAGATVMLLDRDEIRCRSAAENVHQRTGKTPKTFTCDVSHEEAVANVFSLIGTDSGRLDFLVSATMAKPDGYYRPFEKYPLDTWNKVHEINVTGTFHCCREAAALMGKTDLGSIVIVGSTYGVVAPDFRIYDGCSRMDNLYGQSDPLTTPAAYSSSKGALVSLARYLAVLLAPRRIRVNVLTPGGVYDNHEEAFHQAYINRTPLGRMAVWSDYNGAMLFLVSDASRYMTGSNLVVDGGWTAW
jgi:NAD(P)-dependent dehydrogenase (short-subunit alcohol dehydrogenase family)